MLKFGCAADSHDVGVGVSESGSVGDLLMKLVHI